jgi:hypothetical protein
VTQKSPSYWWAAFTARPFGMPIPPNWFGLATFAMLGAVLSPGFFILGAGVEIAYLAWLANNKRFRATVDAQARALQPDEQRYRALLDPLDAADRARQTALEQRASDIVASLDKSPVMAAHADSVEQLVWLHLRLLSALEAISRVVATAKKESARLADQETSIDARLAASDVDPDLRRSLEQQKAVIDARQAAHIEAARRKERIDAELSRIDQQVALIREQTLLATDESRIGSSLDALTASFNEANRWLDSQRDLIGSLDFNDSASLPRHVLRGRTSRTAVSEGESR